MTAQHYTRFQWHTRSEYALASVLAAQLPACTAAAAAEQHCVCGLLECRVQLRYSAQNQNSALQCSSFEYTSEKTVDASNKRVTVLYAHAL